MFSEQNRNSKRQYKQTNKQILQHRCEIHLFSGETTPTHVGHLRSSHFTAISGRHLLTGPYERHLGATLKLICSLRSSISRHTYIHTYTHIHTHTHVRCRARQVQPSESFRHTHAYTHTKRERDREREFFGSSLIVLVVPNSTLGAS